MLSYGSQIEIFPELPMIGKLVGKHFRDLNEQFDVEIGQIGQH